MSSKTPLVSVVMPAYNSQKYLKEAIDSVLNQTHKNLELIVIDDGSTDGTPDIVKNYEDPRLSTYRVNRLGVSGARNTALKKAKGEYVAFCDSDDVWFKEKLATQLKVLDGNSLSISQATFLGGPLDGRATMDLSQIPSEPHEAWMRLVKANFINLSSLIAPLSSVIGAGGFNEQLHFAEDYNLSISLLASGLAMKVINEPLLHYRVLETGLSNNPKQELIMARIMYSQAKVTGDQQDSDLLLASGADHLRGFLRMKLGTSYYSSFREELELVHDDMPRSVLKWVVGVYLRSGLIRAIVTLLRKVLTRVVRIWKPKK